jgi:hypothetical protein
MMNRLFCHNSAEYDIIAEKKNIIFLDRMCAEDDLRGRKRTDRIIKKQETRYMMHDINGYKDFYCTSFELMIC